jgi:hypothetical protein
MIDVHLPTTDGGERMMSRDTQPDRDRKRLLEHLKPEPAPEPPPKLATGSAPNL